MNTQNRQHGVIDTQAERDYWQGRYDKESYYEAGHTYDDYEGAYRTGYEGRDKYAGRSFDQAENELRSDWESAKGKSRLAWEKAKHAARAAWDRIERAMPGDADRDGR
jgi:hypothetical protein